MRDALIDPEEFPFTEPELCSALALWLGDSSAREESARHAAGMRGEVVERAVFQARLVGLHPALREAEVGTSFGYGVYFWYTAEALALLTLVDADLAARAHAHRLARRLAARPQRERQAVWRATGAVDIPMPTAVAEALDAEDAVAERMWEKLVKKMACRVAKARRVEPIVRT